MILEPATLGISLPNCLIHSSTFPYQSTRDKLFKPDTVWTSMFISLIKEGTDWIFLQENHVWHHHATMSWQLLSRTQSLHSWLVPSQVTTPLHCPKKKSLNWIEQHTDTSNMMAHMYKLWMRKESVPFTNILRTVTVVMVVIINNYHWYICDFYYMVIIVF